jgi:hypothetical protein
MAKGYGLACYLPIFGGSRKAMAKKRVEMARARIRMYAKLSMNFL